ncbi:unnamed protein product [Vitrella brassicaformis CCMP3155]|uniref:Uncharacterized protein n=1 Tax=Vitrella brassicaformis (strain CCMP3155) TaxID=1169540 RepID=A0A0G4GG47_VITBC|nr:unnamed protein product [Vitrella brassicaformis CCMP3155]|eukprot:CEM28339.1 unnamed protein product [Vitrella brassicaformis CCMP3155]
MEVLDLDNNNFSGPIPAELAAELGQLSKLRQLSLADNRLSGPLLIEMGGWKSMEVLGLYNNNFSGPIPAELGQLSKLQVLNLGNNRVDGREGPVWAELIPAINRSDKQDLHWSDIIHIVRTKKADPRPHVDRPSPSPPPPPPPSAPEEQAASPSSFVQEIASKIEGAFDMVAQSVPPPPQLPTHNAITDLPNRVPDRGQPQTRPLTSGRPLSADVSPSKTLEFTVEIGTDFQSFMSGHDMNEWRLRLHLADFLGVSPALVHCLGVTAGAGEVFAAAASPSTLMTFTVHPEAHLDRLKSPMRTSSDVSCPPAAVSATPH